MRASQLCRHPRRSTRLLLTAAALAIVALAPAAPAQAATNTCSAAALESGNRVLLANSQSVLFASKRRKQNYVCTYSSRRILRVQSYACCSQEKFTLGGRYLAYSYRLDAADNEVDELGVVDLRAGKRIKYGASSRLGTFGVMDNFLVTARGTLAWVQRQATRENGPVDGDPTVHVASPGAEPRQLDSGAIDVDSLAISTGGKHLYWTKNGATATAALQ